MQNLSKRQMQLYRKLHQKKYRKEFGLFMAEGRKTVEELLRSDLEVEALIIRDDMVDDIRLSGEISSFICTEGDMKNMSLQVQSDGILAVAKIPERARQLEGNILYCDRLNDPGNLGSMIRLSEWFGITSVYLSPSSVDAYNPKVVQSARGSLFRTNVYEDVGFKDLTELKERGYQIIGADLEGQPIEQFQARIPWILVMGSESHGIDPALSDHLDAKVTIAPARADAKIDSLNVGHATAIILYRLSDLGM
jgi:TrmH family RNA methyltransferase